MSGSDIDKSVPLDMVPLHSGNFIVLVDQDGTINYGSPSIESALGYDQDDLVGDRLTERVHPDDREQVAGLIQALTADQADTVESVEYRHEQPDGSYARVKSVGSAEPTDDGHYPINTADISEQRTDEEGPATNKRLSEFAKVVSHDLRNPLTVASGNVELLSEDLDGEDERLERASRAHERMETLIQDLLTLAQTGSQVSSMEWVSFPDICEASWETVSTGSTTLVVEADGKIRADRSRLQQLLENLMRNAVEHGGDDVTLTIGELPDRSGFYVADDGVGIDKSKRDRVFESGFSTMSDGTGFGLSIVSEIVEAHGWQIDLTESDEGGARFEIYDVEWRAQSA